MSDFVLDDEAKEVSRELDTPLPDFLAPLVELARKLEFNVTFL